MGVLHIAILAVVQGITEFLPVSASGHLAVIGPLAGWSDQGPVIDLAVYGGMLGAVVVYFSRDLWAMVAGVFRFFSGRRDPGARLAAQVVIGTVPLVAAGYATQRYMPDGIGGIEVIGWTTLGFGIVLYLTDRLGMTIRRLEHLGCGDALVVGIAQVLALVPGTSRAGITMSAARILGFERVDAARFSMLLSIPAIVGAGLVKSLDLMAGGTAVATVAIVAAAGTGFVASLVSIALLMAWLERRSFTPFVIYRILLGGVLLGLAYGWNL